MQQFIDIALRRSPYKLNRVSHAPLSLPFYPPLSLCLCVFSLFYCPQTLTLLLTPVVAFCLLLLLLMLAGFMNSHPKWKVWTFIRNANVQKVLLDLFFVGCLKRNAVFINLYRCRCPFALCLILSLCLSVFFGQSKRISWQTMSIFKLLRFPTVFIASHKGDKCRLRYAYSLLSYLWSKLNSRQHFNNWQRDKLRVCQDIS